MEEEMTEQLQAGHRERIATRRGERNGYYQRGLTTEAGHIEQLRVPRAREGPFLTEVFESKDGATSWDRPFSRIAQRLEETLSEWRTRCLDDAYPYLYLDPGTAADKNGDTPAGVERPRL